MERTLNIRHTGIIFIGVLFVSCFAYGFIPEGADLQEVKKMVAQIKAQSRKQLEQKKTYSEVKELKTVTPDIKKHEQQNPAKKEPTDNRHIFIIPYWAQVLFAILFLGTLTWLLLPYYKKKEQNNRDGGFTIIELLVTAAMMVFILIAVASIFFRGQVIMDRLGGTIDSISSKDMILNALSKEFRQAGSGDSTYPITISDGNSQLSFYKKTTDSSGDIQWTGPITIFLSGDKLVRQIGPSTYVIATGVSNLSFAHNNNILSAQFTLDGKQYNLKVKIRAS